ncbi:D-alanine--D-alanine ligase family protein, partial [Desertibaculum subflavum]|uniref:D-alanine--D-alanine ligase family protein n=1 Tax=Desertibaculum subflavum TaxID=2268458 RepID=UPI0013C5013E
RGESALAIAEDAPAVAPVPAGGGQLLRCDGGAAPAPFDVMFPVLHGPNGEDGTVQGALELAQVPYVGSRVMGSAAAMDKDIAKRLMRDAGLPIVAFVSMTRARPLDWAAAAAAVGEDMFVKPANMGSSVGVARARSAAEFASACENAFRFDDKILAEAAVDRAREVECSVLEEADGTLRASLPGEIVPAEGHGFYSYDAKYIDADGAVFRIPAAMSEAQIANCQTLAIEAFRLLACESMARVDFFLDAGRDRLLVNEVNTLPGFTSISMYPKLWEASGLAQPELMDKLIAHALARHAKRAGLAHNR